MLFFVLDYLLKYSKLGEIDMIFSISEASVLLMGKKLGSSRTQVALLAADLNMFAFTYEFGPFVSFCFKWSM